MSKCDVPTSSKMDVVTGSVVGRLVSLLSTESLWQAWAFFRAETGQPMAIDGFGGSGGSREDGKRPAGAR
jgi:hypothetical protein